MKEKGVNALNGLSSFLLKQEVKDEVERALCQRPKRAFFISTWFMEEKRKHKNVCQRPKRAFFISTMKNNNIVKLVTMCQRPKRAFFISTICNQKHLM